MDHSIFFGTESGNSEMVAEDLAAELGTAPPRDLQDVDPIELSRGALNVIVCSTYGEGELPASAQPFAERLHRDGPDLTDVRYAIFGLGDSGYADSYSKGSEILADLLDELGAVRVGDFGRHDAAGFEDPSSAAVAWVRELHALRAAA